MHNHTTLDFLRAVLMKKSTEGRVSRHPALAGFWFLVFGFWFLVFGGLFFGFWPNPCRQKLPQNHKKKSHRPQPPKKKGPKVRRTFWRQNLAGVCPDIKHSHLFRPSSLPLPGAPPNTHLLPSSSLPFGVQIISLPQSRCRRLDT